MEVLTKKLTYEEFQNMEFPDNDTALYELINGNIVRRPSPTLQHQRILKHIFRLMDGFVEKNGLGEVLFAPLDVVLDNENVPQPDIIFISNDRDFVKNEEKGLVIGTPDIVVEILSPGTMKYDRGEKMEVYERFAVREYWLVDPKNKSIEIWEMRENRYKMAALTVETGLVASAVLAGFELEVGDIF